MAAVHYNLYDPNLRLSKQVVKDFGDGILYLRDGSTCNYRCFFKPIQTPKGIFQLEAEKIKRISSRHGNIDHTYLFRIRPLVLNQPVNINIFFNTYFPDTIDEIFRKNLS